MSHYYQLFYFYSTLGISGLKRKNKQNTNLALWLHFCYITILCSPLSCLSVFFVHLRNLRLFNYVLKVYLCSTVLTLPPVFCADSLFLTPFSHSFFISDTSLRVIHTVRFLTFLWAICLRVFLINRFWKYWSSCSVLVATHKVKSIFHTFIFSSSWSLSSNCSWSASFSLVNWAQRSLCDRITSLQRCSKFSWRFTLWWRVSSVLTESPLPPIRQHTNIITCTYCFQNVDLHSPFTLQATHRALKKVGRRLQNFLVSTVTTRNMVHINRILNTVFQPILIYKGQTSYKRQNQTLIQQSFLHNWKPMIYKPVCCY